MERYLVESHHTEEDCHHVVEQFIFHGLINNIDWGCEDGVHVGWAIVDVENKDLAMVMIPPTSAIKSDGDTAGQVFTRKNPGCT